MHRRVRLGTKRRDNYLRHCTLGHTRPQDQDNDDQISSQNRKQETEAHEVRLFYQPSVSSDDFWPPPKKTLTAKLFNVYIQLDLENRPQDISRSHNKNIFQAVDQDSQETTKLQTSLLLPRTSTDFHGLTEPADPVQSGRPRVQDHLHGATRQSGHTVVCPSGGT